MPEKDENMSMQERIDYFYRQSGGPDSPEIDRILKEHLLNGKDHGVPGRKEEPKDAFTEVFLGDHSTQPILMGIMKMRFAMKEQWEAYLNTKQTERRQWDKMKT